MRAFLVFWTAVSAVLSLGAQDTNLAFARFSSPVGQYVELYLHVSGKTVTASAAQGDSLVQGALDFIILFEQGDEIVAFDKFRLNSPAGKRVVDFADTRRYPLINGNYNLRIEVTDAHDETRVKKYTTPLVMDLADDTVALSDIQLLASVTPTDTEGPMVKSGLMMEPLPYNFYSKGANVLTFYQEIYNSDRFINAPFVVSYRIEKVENGETKQVLIGHKRQTPAPVNPLLLQIDISKVPSGNYKLVVDVRDREKQLISSRDIAFQRSNPLLDAQNMQQALASVTIEDEFVGRLTPEELEYSLRAIYPLVPQRDAEMVDIILRADSVRAQRAYLYQFWATEDRAAPERAYLAFMDVAKAVDQMFQSGFRHGFETDRGYVYIKYGRPSDMVRNEAEPTAPPYEIWSYNEVPSTRQNNVRFIFYNPSLAADDFVLLHSDVIGERQNPQWQLQLYKSSPSEHPADFMGGENVPRNIGRQAVDLLNDY